MGLRGNNVQMVPIHLIRWQPIPMHNENLSKSSFLEPGTENVDMKHQDLQIRSNDDPKFI